MSDIETTGLSPDRDIIQLSAFDGNSELNVYVHLRSNQPFSKNDTAVFGITFSFERDIVNYKGRNVKSMDLRLGLLKFLIYL